MKEQPLRANFSFWLIANRYRRRNAYRVCSRKKTITFERWTIYEGHHNTKRKKIERQKVDGKYSRVSSPQVSHASSELVVNKKRLLL